MRYVESKIVARRFAAIAKIARTEAVCVQFRGRPQIVMLSLAEYARLRRQDRQVYAASEIPPRLRAAIKAAKPSLYAAAFDNEIQGDAE